jgi:hypothetical protein
MYNGKTNLNQNLNEYLVKPQTKKATQNNLFENAITKLLLYQGGLPDKVQS